MLAGFLVKRIGVGDDPEKNITGEPQTLTRDATTMWRVCEVCEDSLISPSHRYDPHFTVTPDF